MNAADDLCPTCYGLPGAVNGEVGYGCICGLVSNEGGQGGSIRKGFGQTSDTRLIERALREQWHIPFKKRDELLQRQMDIAADPMASPREASVAFRTILTANEQNLRAAAMAMGDGKNGQVNVNVNTRIDVGAVIDAAQRDEDYIEFLRQRAIAESAAALSNGNGAP